MIAQGTDGVSRSYLAQGVMAGEPMRVHIPIYLSAVERLTLDLVPWVQSWSDLESELFDPIGWFQIGHDVEGWSVCADGFARPRLVGSGRTFIWSAPPPLLQPMLHWLSCEKLGSSGSVLVIFSFAPDCALHYGKSSYTSVLILFLNYQWGPLSGLPVCTNHY